MAYITRIRAGQLLEKILAISRDRPFLLFNHLSKTVFPSKLYNKYPIFSLFLFPLPFPRRRLYHQWAGLHSCIFDPTLYQALHRPGNSLIIFFLLLLGSSLLLVYLCCY